MTDIVTQIKGKMKEKEEEEAMELTIKPLSEMQIIKKQITCNVKPSNTIEDVKREIRTKLE